MSGEQTSEVSETPLKSHYHPLDFGSLPAFLRRYDREMKKVVANGGAEYDEEETILHAGDSLVTSSRNNQHK